MTHEQEIDKANRELRASSGKPEDIGRFERSIERACEGLEKRVLHTYPNGIRKIGLFEQGKQVNQYHE
jgi:hypothetical protein